VALGSLESQGKARSPRWSQSGQASCGGIARTPHGWMPQSALWVPWCHTPFLTLGHHAGVHGDQEGEDTDLVLRKRQVTTEKGQSSF
jgi:hypothetical protein